MTALHWVASRGTGETASILCAAGARVNCRSNDGWTPLHLAALAGRADVVRVLLELGAEAAAVNNQGRTPIQMCESASVKDLLASHEARGGAAAPPAPPPAAQPAAAPLLPPSPAGPAPTRLPHAPAASFVTAAALGEKALSDEIERLKLRKATAAAMLGRSDAGAASAQPTATATLSHDALMDSARGASRGGAPASAFAATPSLGDSAAAAFAAARDFVTPQP
jgi:hypothetical protein